MNVQPPNDGSEMLGSSAAQKGQLPDHIVPVWAALSAQLAVVLSWRDSPFLRRVRRGFRRGIDFYNASDLFVVMTRSAMRYQTVHGAFPNLVDPTRLTEHIFWSNYFRRLKTPETGDKLQTAFFIPDEARELAAIPDVVWRSTEARLPPAEAIEPGTYYLKTNHGSDMFERIQWPLSASEVERLEELFTAHLENPYGYWNGEWWYSCIPREIFLEKSVASAEHPIAWCCYTFRGKVGFITAYRKLKTGSETIWLNPDFTASKWQNAAKPRTQFDMPSKAIRQNMLEAAARIGAPHPFVRVDFLLGDDQRIYLSEMTFSPGNATTPLPRELDVQLGALWAASLIED